MTNNEQSTSLKKWPRGVYFDTNVLRTLPFDIINAEVERLVELAGIFEIPIYIPETAYLEWQYWRSNQVLNECGTVFTGLHKLAKIKTDLPIGEVKRSLENIEESERNYLADAIRKCCFQILPTPAIDVKHLVEMAIRKQRPFEEKKEKGFRDTVILYTIFEKAKHIPEGPHYILSDDAIFDHKQVEELATSNGVELIRVKSLSELITRFESHMTDLKKRLVEYQKGLLTKYLLTQLAIIEKYIIEYGVFPSGYFKFSKSGACLSSFEKIESIRVIEISDVVIGSLPIDGETGKAKIVIITKVEFSVQFSYSPTEPEMKYRVGEERREQGFNLRNIFAKEYQTTIQDRIVILDADIQVNKMPERDHAFDFEFSGLEISDIRL